MILNFAASTDALALVGNPNVGKSMLFGALTGRYAVVSNYPGTTVEVTRGRGTIAGRNVEVIDTPGMYSLLPITDEERVARRILLGDVPRLVVHVVDAKNLERMLPLTLQLLELGLPVVLLLNMMDEARRRGIVVDAAGLEAELGIPVSAAVATRRRGLDEARAALARHGGAVPDAAALVDYGDLEPAIAELARALPERLGPAARGVALLLLQGDDELLAALGSDEPEAAAAAERALARVTQADAGAMALAVTARRHAHARQLARRHLRAPACTRRTAGDRLSDLMIQPWTGIPILLAVLYFGLYRFVGVFGAGELVDLLESRVFGVLVNPHVNAMLARLLPGDGWAYWGRELIGGDYGVITLGLTYAMAIVLPLVSLFFLFFSVLEDSGYFPRLAMLVDRLFKRLGLNGRAVIPLVLGFGCGTMATMVTRIQETRREKLITTLLLAVAVPCSAQMGVVTGLLAAQPASFLGVSWAFLAWAGIMLVAFLATGAVASRALAGRAATFHMELPPLRWPRPGNVIVKTMARMRWYFAEVLPLFVLVSVFIWIGRITGIFDLLISGLRPIVQAIGLPGGSAQAFLFGFFRRDFGAAGLFDMQKQGLLSGGQLLVACVTLTLFLPCVAQLLVMKRERGLRVAAITAVGVMAGAFLAGGAVNAVLVAFGGLR